MSLDADRPAMSFDDAVNTRRSIRGFLDKPVPRKLVEEVIARHERLDIHLELKDVPRLMVKRLTLKRLVANLITEAFSPRDQAASIEASLSRIDAGIEARRAKKVLTALVMAPRENKETLARMR